MTYGVKRSARLARTARFFIALLVASPVAIGGCGDDPPAGKACDESSCGQDERCIQGSCRAPCTRQSDCAVGTNCALWGFSDGSQGNYCVTLPYAEDGSTGQFEPCAGDGECDTLRGFRCFGGECRPQCRSHFDCAGEGICTSGVDGAGDRVQYCEPSPQPPGRYYTRCPQGDECDADAGFSCLGAGVGDLDAYCTADCTSDSDCAPGFYCGKISTVPCEDACDFRGVPDDPDCAPPEQIGDGLPYRCGRFGVERSVCRAREFCSPCQSDSDCLAIPNTLCADDGSGTKICTQLCDPDVGSCPWGNAGICGFFDEALGLATCAHRSGSCTGSGRGCDPCITDADCGENGLCTSSQFTGERWCIDLSTSCDCEGNPASGFCTGGGCPETPSGLRMICIDSPGSVIDGACYGANTAANPILSSPQTGCWAAL